MLPSTPPGQPYVPPPIPSKPTARGRDIAIGLLGMLLLPLGLFILAVNLAGHINAPGDAYLGILIGSFGLIVGGTVGLSILARRKGRPGFAIGMIVAASLWTLFIGGCAFVLNSIFRNL